MTWARISHPLTVQFAKILPETDRRRDDLKKGKNWLNLKTYYKEYLTILRPKTRLWHIVIAEDAQHIREITWA